MKLFCLCQIWALHQQRLLNNTNEWQPFTTYQTVFSHLIKLVKVVKNKFVEKIANNFLELGKAPPKFEHPFWNDVTKYSDEYVPWIYSLYAMECIETQRPRFFRQSVMWKKSSENR